MSRMMTRGCYTVPEQVLCRTDDDAAVVTAEAQAVGDRRFGLPWPCLVEHDVDGECRVDGGRPGGGRDQSMLDREQHRDRLECARSAEGVAGDSLGRRHRYAIRSEH